MARSLLKNTDWKVILSEAKTTLAKETFRLGIPFQTNFFLHHQEFI